MPTVFVCDEVVQAIKLGAYDYITKPLIANTITAALLPIGRRRLPAAVPNGAPPLVALDVVERQHIKGVLKRTGFHKSRTDEILGIPRKTLDRKIVEFGLNAGRAE